MGKELLFAVTRKDFKISYFSGSGAGGQHRNKHRNCIRIHHVESGAITTGQSNRSRVANQREAMRGLVKHAKFKLWQSQKVQESLIGKSIKKVVEEMTIPKYLKIETMENNKWVSA